MVPAKMKEYVARLGWLVIVLVMASPALAQRVLDVAVVGQVWYSDAMTAKPWEQKFEEGMRELGYVEGQNVRTVVRYANGDASKLSELLNELLALPVDVLVISPKAIRAATEATKTTPIVCYFLGDAVRDGLIRNLARPGGNLTGMYAQETEVTGKRLEIARELLPGIKRAAVLFDATDKAASAQASAFQALANDSGVSIQAVGVSSAQELVQAFRTLERGRVQAIFVAENPLLYLHRRTLMNLAGRLPVMAYARDWVRDGALFTYSPNLYEMLKRTAVYVDRILKGAKAGDIPIEQAQAFELTINLRTAKALGLAVPQSILLRADEVVH